MDVLTLATAYLLGSLPFGLLLMRWAGYGDITKVGSGNIGATNVLRVGGKKLGAATFLLDFGKGVLAVYLAMGLSDKPHMPLYAAYAVAIGHMFSIFLRFKGGKGIATSVGALTIIHWPVAGATFAFWLVVMFWTRLVSLASVASAVACPFLGWALAGSWLAFAILPLSILVLFKHRTNIARLHSGEESRIGK